MNNSSSIIPKLPSFFKENFDVPPILEEKFSQTFSKKTINDNKIYVLLPALFSDALNKRIKEVDLLRITIASYLHFITILKVDDAFDNKTKPVDDINLLFVVHSQEIVQKILADYFHYTHPFWIGWKDKHHLYYKHIQIKNSLESYNNLSFSNYKKIISNRNILGLIALDSVLNLYSDGSKINSTGKLQYQKLRESYNSFSLAAQMLDDIKDLKEDIENHQINYVLFNFQYLDVADPKLYEKIYQKFYLTGIFKKAYEKIIRILKNSQIQIEKNRENFWNYVINELIIKVKDEYYDVNGFINVIHERNTLIKKGENVKQKNLYPRLKIQNSNLKIKINDAVYFLLSQKQKGFGELKHIMFLNKNIGLSNNKEIHCNDTFQRAIIADIFCDCKVLSLEFFNKKALSEIRYLKSKKNADEIGGWSYYPTIPEVAADADDLGQILQVFVRCNLQKQIPQFFSIPIRLLLEERINTDGGIETWIIPKKSSDQNHIVQEKYNAIWGKGPDVEVMANFLFALTLYDYVKYRDTIIKGALYILNKAEKNYLWKSKWYYGYFYGTYTAARLFDAISKVEPSFRNEHLIPVVSKIISNLTLFQNKDGGWGLNNKKSDFLNTSFALLCYYHLQNYANNKKEINNKMQVGVEYLLQCNIKDCYTEFNIPFIRPRMNDPYSSKTITVAYILKILIQLQSIYKN